MSKKIKMLNRKVILITGGTGSFGNLFVEIENMSDCMQASTAGDDISQKTLNKVFAFGLYEIL